MTTPLVRWGLYLAVSCLALTATAEDWFQRVEVTTEQLVEGKMDFTVRFTPAKTHTCDMVVVECVYHQEFPWEDYRGRKITKILEPVTFVYRRPEVKMVNDLDCYISFRAPYGLKSLVEKYGPKTFNGDSPVSVPRLKISGSSGGATLWSYTLPVGEALDSAALARQTRDAAAPTEEE